MGVKGGVTLTPRFTLNDRISWASEAEELGKNISCNLLGRRIGKVWVNRVKAETI